MPIRLRKLPIFLILIVLAINFSFLYFGLPDCPLPEKAEEKACVDSGLSGLLAIAYRALMLFTLEGNNLDPQFTDAPDWVWWAFQMLRIATPFALAAAVLHTLSNVWDATTLRFSRWTKRKTAVVIGLGQIGRMFAREYRNRNLFVVGVDSNPSDELVAFCQRHSIRLIVGDGADPDVLNPILDGRVERVAVVTDDDVRNMEVAGRIRRLRMDQEAPNSLNLYVHIFDPRLALRLHDHHLPSTTGNATVSMLPFSFYTVTARELLRTVPLHQFADLRGQRRIHAAIFGFGSMGESLFVQIAQLGHYKDFEPPRISIFDRNPDDCRRIIAARYPQIDQACRWTVDPIEFGRTALDDSDTLRDIENSDGITATFLCLGVEADNIAAALELRALMTRYRRFLAPIYVRIRNAEGLEDFMPSTGANQCRRFQDELRPFGLVRDILGASGIEGDSEWLAQILHFGYTARMALTAEERSRDQDGDGIPDFYRACVRQLSSRREALLPEWMRIPEPFRDSSRAGADHLRVKLAGLGYDLSNRPTSAFRLAELPSKPALRWLDRLEHTRWMADRAAIGYRPSDTIKDDDRRLHRLLVPFEALRHEDAKDRDMNLLLLDGVLGQDDGGTDVHRLRRNHTVGVIGHAAVGCHGLPAGFWESAQATALLARLRACTDNHRLVLLAAIEEPAEAEFVWRLLDNVLPVEEKRPEATQRRLEERSIVLRCPRFLPVPRIKDGDDPLLRSQGNRPQWWRTPEWVIDMIPAGRFGDDFYENYYAQSANDLPRPRRDAVAAQRARALAYWIERCDSLIYLAPSPSPSISTEVNPTDSAAAFLELAERLFENTVADESQRTRDWQALYGYWNHPEHIPACFSSVPLGRFARHREVSGLIRVEQPSLGGLEWVSISGSEL